MMPAAWPRAERAQERLLHIDPQTASLRDLCVAALPELLAPGDVLIVNDAATLPASLKTDDGLELRLLARLRNDREWQGVLFGAGDWRTPTERRPAPPFRGPGSMLRFGADLAAKIVRVDPEQPRLIELRFDRGGAALFAALYRIGKPVQYAHLEHPLELWHVQNAFASRPWAVELASAGRPLSFGLLRALRRRGVELAGITHAAGLSSIGGRALDRRLPVPERYDVPQATCDAIARAKQRGGRVVAAGTTVVRALEARARQSAPGELGAGEGEARLVIGPGFRPRVVDGLLTGMHPPGTSHFALLEAFAPRPLLERALAHAEREGYLEHEFGDSCLVLGG